jgi:hypothetical protein
MPICERDPWRFQFFEKAHCPADVFIPTDDTDCAEWYPEQAWIYDKLKIARTQSIRSGTRENLPSQFPVFSKPNINLKGMGVGGKVVYSETEFKKHCNQCHMWMEFFEGAHVSTDCAIIDGEIKWMRHATGIVWHEGMFKHWTIHAGPMPELEKFLRAWTKRHMPNYVGMMNFETIGGRIIECHLRFADQWCDLYGHKWLESLINLYAKKTWNLDTSADEEGYSVPLFASHGGPFRHPTIEAQAKIRAMTFVTSLQITFHELKPDELHPMPPGGFRLGIINCTNLEAGFEARLELAKCFPNAKILLPDELIEKPQSDRRNDRFGVAQSALNQPKQFGNSQNF